jgi:hypothetical protein
VVRRYRSIEKPSTASKITPFSMCGIVRLASMLVGVVGDGFCWGVLHCVCWVCLVVAVPLSAMLLVLAVFFSQHINRPVCYRGCSVGIVVKFAVLHHVLRINHYGGWSVVLEATGCWSASRHGMLCCFLDGCCSTLFQVLYVSTRFYIYI